MNAQSFGASALQYPELLSFKAIALALIVLGLFDVVDDAVVDGAIADVLEVVGLEADVWLVVDPFATAEDSVDEEGVLLVF